MRYHAWQPIYQTMKFLADKSLNEATGIYAVRGAWNDFHLVGQTMQGMLKRYKQHNWKLRRNRHENPALQNSYNRHGSDCFEFLVLESAPISTLNEREIYWIKKLNSMRGQKGWKELKRGWSKRLIWP